MKRLNTDREIAPLVAQFVPVKLDIDSDEYREWRSDFASEGNTIPKLFVVRADGESLYGKSGSLNGDALPQMLLQALRNSGRILSPREAGMLVNAADTFESRKKDGDLSGAINALNRLKKIGAPGAIASYAAPAIRVNALVMGTIDEANDELSRLEADIQSDNPALRLESVLGFLKTKRIYGGLKPLKPSLAKFQKEFVSTSELRQLVREAKTIDAVRGAKSKSAKKRSVEKLKSLITTTQIDAVESVAAKLLAEIESESESESD